MGTALQAAMKQQFGAEAMKKMMSQSFLMLPTEDIAVGGSWDLDLAMMGMRMDSTTTLTGLQDGAATLTTTTAISRDADYTAAGGAFGVLYDELEGSQTGTYRIDVKTGMLLEADMTMDMRGTIRMSMPGISDDIAAMMPPIPMAAVSTIRIEARKVE